jgi:hypothetical protein
MSSCSGFAVASVKKLTNNTLQESRVIRDFRLLGRGGFGTMIFKKDVFMHKFSVLLFTTELFALPAAGEVHVIAAKNMSIAGWQHG